MKLHAAGREFRDFFQRALQVAVNFRSETSSLFDRGIFGKHEKLGARRGSLPDPKRDLLFPLGERFRLPDRVLSTRNFEGRRLAHQRRLHPELHLVRCLTRLIDVLPVVSRDDAFNGGIAAFVPERIKWGIIGRFQRVVLRPNDPAERRMCEAAEAAGLRLAAVEERVA